MQYRKSFLFFALVLISSTAAFSITLKIGSLAPRNSPWDRTLNEIASEWKNISGGRIELKIYPGGITGAEGDTLRKMKVGALDGMVVTTMGLNKISTDLFVISLPLLIRDEDELDYVLDRIQGSYDKIMADKGFKLVGWTKAGWLNIFSRKPVFYPEDLENQKLGFTSGEVILTKILQDLGFHIIPSDSIDWLSSLQSGRVDALLLSSLLAAAYQVFPIAKNMLEFPISPLLGAIVFSERSWKKIPETYRQDFLDITAEKIKSLNEESFELEKTAMNVMLDNGLKVNLSDEYISNSWIKIVNDLYEKEDGIIGSLVSQSIYNETVSYIEDYRKNSIQNGN